MSTLITRTLLQASLALTPDPRAAAIARNNARIRWEAGVPEEDEEEPGDSGAARCAAAARESES